jgi:hypothetical protein
MPFRPARSGRLDYRVRLSPVGSAKPNAAACRLHWVLSPVFLGKPAKGLQPGQMSPPFGDRIQMNEVRLFWNPLAIAEFRVRLIGPASDAMMGDAGMGELDRLFWHVTSCTVIWRIPFTSRLQGHPTDELLRESDFISLLGRKGRTAHFRSLCRVILPVIRFRR